MYLSVPYSFDSFELRQSSQLAEPLWTNPGVKSGISVCKLISTINQKKVQVGTVQHSPKILACEEKASTTTTTILLTGEKGCVLLVNYV